MGPYGTLLQWDGSRWTPRVSGTDQTLTALAPAGADLWAVGAAGVVLRLKR